MKIAKKDLLAAVELASRLGTSHISSPWLRSTVISADQGAVLTAWGSGGSVLVPLKDASGNHDEAYAADTKELTALVRAALGDTVTIGLAADGLRIASARRIGKCQALDHPEQYAPPDPVSPSEGHASVALYAGSAHAVARGLRAAAACVDREACQQNLRHVTVYAGKTLDIVATDGASCVWLSCDSPSDGHSPVAMSPDDARLLADAIGEEEDTALVIQATQSGILARVGTKVLNFLRRLDGHIFSLDVMQGQLAKWTGGVSLKANLRELLNAVRYAGEFATDRTTAAIIEWTKATATISSEDGRASTTIDVDAGKSGRALFAADRLSRALGSLDAKEMGSHEVRIDAGGALPMQVIVTGPGWTRRHIVMPMQPEVALDTHHGL